MDLTGKTIALLISPKGTEEVEFTEPMKALHQAGATVHTVSTSKDDARAVNNDLEPAGSHPVDLTFTEANADDYDGVVIPGGTVGADTLRAEKDAVDFIRRFVEQGKPVAAICHGPWLLVEADILRGRTVTSYPSLKTDIRNAGATWVDQEVVVDSGLVTSRKPDDLPAFCAKLVEEFAEGKHEDQARSV